MLEKNLAFKTNVNQDIVLCRLPVQCFVVYATLGFSNFQQCSTMQHLGIADASNEQDSVASPQHWTCLLEAGPSAQLHS